jgi:hypothetical protein
VPSGFAAHPCRRPLALIAAILVVLQAFVAGVATARAVPATDPIDVICHGAGGGTADTTAPDAGKVAHLCCEYCMSAVPALAPPDAPGIALPPPRPASRLQDFAGYAFVISPGAVRAGLSQAPPASA